MSFTTSNVRAGNTILEEIVVTGSRQSYSRDEASGPAPTFDEVEYRATVTVTFEVTPSE